MDDPLHTEKNVTQGQLQPSPQEQTPEGIAIEETPIVEDAPPAPIESGPGRPRKGSFIAFIETLLILGILFTFGVWIGMVLPDYLSRFTTEEAVPPPPRASVTVAPTPTPEPPQWKIYRVISGTTKLPVEGISYQLPSSMLEPVCDGASCASQGTYLPGGSRFTVAARGSGQLLPDYRGRVVSDLRGQAFTVGQRLVSGRPAVEFSGDFSGATVSGYSFSKMRGVMVELNENASVEINHFTPLGVTANFVADEVLFDEILAKVVVTTVGPVIPAGTSEKGIEPSTPSGSSESLR